MAEGQELAVAVVRFIGSDEQYQATRAQVLASSRQLTTEIAAQGQASGAASGLVDQFGRTVATMGTAQQAAAEAVRSAVAPTRDLASAARPAASGLKDLGEEANQGSRGVLEHARQTRSLAQALLADLVPGLRTGTREVQLIGREFGGSTEAGVTFGLAFGGLALAIGKYLGLQLEANRAVQAVRYAVLTDDLAAAATATTAAGRALSDFATNVDLAAHKVEGQNAVMGVLAFVMNGVDAILGTTNRKVSEAIELNTGYLGALAMRLSALQAEKAVLEGQQATIGIDKQRAQSVEALTALYAQEAENIVRLGNIAAQEAIRTARLEEAKITALLAEAHTEEEIATLRERQRRIEETAQATAGSIREKAAASAAAAEIASAKAATAGWVALYEQQGKLATIQGAAQLDAAKTGQALVEAAHKAAQADAEFFSVSDAGLQAYQQKRRASIQDTADLEIATLGRVLEAELARQQAALSDPALGVAGRQVALNALAAAEAKYAADVQAISGRTMVELAQDASKITEERRAQNATSATNAAAYYAHLAALGQEDYRGNLRLLIAKGQDENLSNQQRNQFQEQAVAMYGTLISKAAGYYQQLASLGQVSVAQQLAFLTEQSTNEQLKTDERIGFAVAAATMRRDLEQATFDLSQALGTTNAAAAVAHARTIADSYVAGSTERIKAETQWATAAIQLQTQVAAIGRTLSNQAIDALKAQGQEEVSLASITAQSASAREAAMATLKEFLRGGTVNATELKKAMDLSATFAALTASGQTAGDAIKTDFTLAKDALAGIPRTAGDAASSLTGIGGAATGVDASVGRATSDILSQLTRIDAATDRVSVSFTDAGRAAGTGLADGITRGNEAVGAAIDGLYGVMQSHVEVGNSRLADSIYLGVINRIVAALDAEANRS